MTVNQRIEDWLGRSQDDFHATSGAARPHVSLCYAQSWDGSITTSPGETLALSSEAGLRLTHQLRSLHDGILVGIGTVLADNPRLTVRAWEGRDPQPIVLDSQLRMPASSELCQRAEPHCWVLTTPEADGERSDCDLIVVPGDEAGHVNLELALAALYERGIRNLMVEGGAAVITAFLQAGLADAIVLTVAPVLIGGYNAFDRLDNSDKAPFPRLAPLHSQQLEDEIIVWGQLHYHSGH